MNNKEWYQKNKERMKEYHKNYYKKKKSDYIKRDKIQQEKNKIFNKEFREKYGISWRTVKAWGINSLSAIERASKKCEICGLEKNNLTIHHKDNKGWNYRQKGLAPNNNIENLMVICNNCHTKLHHSTCNGSLK